MEIKPYVVYLSSSAHSNWREPVKAKYVKNGNVVFVGPCENHGLSDAMGAPGDVKPGHQTIAIDPSILCSKLELLMPRQRRFCLLMKPKA